MNDDYFDYFQSHYHEVSESKINSLVKGIERKAFYPVALKFHKGSIADNEKSIKNLTKQANLKKNADIKLKLLESSIPPYRNTIQKHQIAIRIINRLMEESE
jgi:hypothetical protein